MLLQGRKAEQTAAVQASGSCENVANLASSSLLQAEFAAVCVIVVQLRAHPTFRTRGAILDPAALWCFLWHQIGISGLQSERCWVMMFLRMLWSEHCRPNVLKKCSPFQPRNKASGLDRLDPEHNLFAQSILLHARHVNCIEVATYSMRVKTRTGLQSLILDPPEFGSENSPSRLGCDLRIV